MHKPTKFQNKVYQLCKKVPKGKVTTYRDIAHALNTKAYRAVGSALNKNPFGAWGRVGGKKGCRRQRFIVPCHRVINVGGFIGQFAKGINTKIKLLKKEGIEIKNNKISEKYIFKLI